jgi:CPA1 family monovalent cation:H+ antiporter
VEYAGQNELILLAVLTGITALVALAPILHVPYPILLVLGGLALGFVPGIPEIQMPPEVVLVGVLPPLLYAAAFFTGVRDLRRKIKQISLLAVGLVLATMVGVAVVAHAVTDLTWAACFVLGAVVSPTDPVAATAISRRLGVPRNIVTVVEGESLLNDATALVLYASAVTAVVAGTFSFFEASLQFVVSVIGGVLIGLAVGWVVALIRIRLDNRCSRATSPTSRRRRSTSPECWPQSRSASTSVGERRSSRRRRCGWRAAPSSRRSSSS